MATKVDFVPFENLFSIPLRNGLTRPKSVRGKGLKMINMGELFAHSRINNVETDRVPFSDNENSFLLKSRDLLFARQSLVLAGAGKCSIFVGDNEEVTYEGHIIRARINSEIADPYFYYYFFNSPNGRQVIESIVEQVAAAGIRGSDLAKLNVPYLPLPEQHSIVGVLGALDDKIELNRRMNVTLESMARAVFHEWFVDNEEAGNWEIKTIGDICEFAYGKGLKADGRNIGPIPVYGSNGQIGWHNEYLVKGPGIVVGRKGNPGIVIWTQKDFFPIDTTFYVVLKNKDISLYWLYFELLSQNLPSLGADSAVPGLNRNIAYMSDVIYPSQKKMKDFDDFSGSLFDKINANKEESRTLVSLRDALLPKLMRGEVRVKDAE
jgi:type I restriction enzyme S subunit